MTYSLPQLMNAAHHYARSYAASSGLLRDPSLSKDEVLHRIELTRCAWERVSLMIADAVDAAGRSTSRDLLSIGWELAGYAESRREGQGTEAAAGLRELLAVAL